MKLFGIGIIHDNDDVDSLIEQLEEMKENGFTSFVYGLGKDTEENRGEMVRALKTEYQQ